MSQSLDRDDSEESDGEELSVERVAQPERLPHRVVLQTAERENTGEISKIITLETVYKVTV